MTAWPSTVSLRTFPMNEVDISDQDEMLRSDPASKAAESPKPRLRARRRLGGRLFAIGAFLLLTAGIALGASRHHSKQQQVRATADQTRHFAPMVAVAPVEASPLVSTVTLPGTTAAFAAANVSARATGYIDKRNVDIGDHVKQDELLAELAVPELDEQIAQNEATLDQLKAAVQQAQANATLPRATWGRGNPLLRDGWVTGHQGDIDLQTGKANEDPVGVAQAHVASQDRLLRVLH